MLRIKLLSFGFLLAFVLSISYTSVTRARADGWVNVEVLSFDGQNILFKLEICVVGNHAEDSVWLKVEPASVSASNGSGTIQGSVVVEVWRGISNVIFDEGTNVTVFTYQYSYNHTYYEAEPKLAGYLLFPYDEHRLTLYISPSFSIILDMHPSVCRLPSQNYEGTFQVTPTPTSEHNFMHRFELEIKHSPAFVSEVSLMLSLIIGSLYVLTLVMASILSVAFVGRRKDSPISNLIRVSSATIFFIPAFEIAFNSLKSPLPLVFPDILLALLVPINAAIIIASLVYKRRSNNQASDDHSL
jgi:hypothetical protein